MALQPNGPAPYSTATAVITVLDAWRDRGFGVPVTPDILTRAGVPESLGRRTFQSLVTLDLLEADGQPTQQFQDFRATRGDEEYRARMQEWLRGVYADVLQYADPSTHSYERVTEAFRSYEPAGQRRGMASLLVGLWKYAGLPVGATLTDGESRPRRNGTRSATARSKPVPKQREKVAPQAQNDSSLNEKGLPPGLVGLLHQIPRGGASWTSRRRDDFLRAFGAVLDFSVPVDDRPPDAEADNHQEAEA